jgi:hypothetical protein
MKTIQLIKATETTLYLQDGKVISEVLTPSEKLRHTIFGETKQLKTEEVVERWNVRSNKEGEKRFWDYMNENKIQDSSNYYIVIS